ncbi:MAG TPA: pilin [Candidatus Paceibacterota bacterium]|nr:pilin [Candidatus Paceibacterota bacterium]
MKVFKSPLFWFGVFFLTPAAVVFGADALTPCGTLAFTGSYGPGYFLSATSCNFCYLAKLIQNIVNFLLMVAIPISVAMFAWAGVMYFTAGGNPARAERGRKIFAAVLLGFCIALGAWLFVQVFLQTVTNPNFFSANNWINLDCSTFNDQRSRNVSISTVLSGNGLAPSTVTSDPTSPTLAPPPDSGEIQAAISQATSRYIGTVTTAGPGGGNLACAWAVNNILGSAGISSIDGDSVPDMETVLKSGRGQPVDQSQGQPGDIVIQGNQWHVGICQDVGCTRVISNSSGARSFTNDQTMSAFSRGAQSRVYRVVN